MKKRIIQMITFISVGILIGGCAKVEPTELKVESITEKVKVQGVVRYNALKKDGTIKNDIKVKAGATVAFDVKYEEYTSDTAVVSSKRYTATTNGEGFYSISLSCLPSKTLNYTVSIEFEENTWGKDPDGDPIEAKAIFKYSAPQSTYCGQTNVLNIMATNAGFPYNPDLTTY